MYRCIELKPITFIGGLCFSFFYKEIRVLACARKYKFNGMLGLPAAFQLLDFGGNILSQKFEIEKSYFWPLKTRKIAPMGFSVYTGVQNNKHSFTHTITYLK
jgi:hypothetical protein